MARKNRTPEENARREKIRELLQMANIGSMDDIQNLFKETIAEFMENVWRQSWMRTWATADMTTRTRLQTTAGMVIAAKRSGPALETWKSRFPGTGKGNLNPRC